MATAAAPSLEAIVYTSASTHDALGRVLTAISPDGSEVAYGYNERGPLRTVDCKHRGSSTSTPVVAELTYNVTDIRDDAQQTVKLAVSTTHGILPEISDDTRDKATPAHISAYGRRPAGVDVNNQSLLLSNGCCWHLANSWF